MVNASTEQLADPAAEAVLEFVDDPTEALVVSSVPEAATTTTPVPEAAVTTETTTEATTTATSVPEAAMSAATARARRIIQATMTRDVPKPAPVIWETNRDMMEVVLLELKEDRDTRWNFSVACLALYDMVNFLIERIEVSNEGSALPFISIGRYIGPSFEGKSRVLSRHVSPEDMSRKFIIDFCPAQPGVRPEDEDLLNAWEYVLAHRHVRYLNFVRFSGIPVSFLAKKDGFRQLTHLELVVVDGFMSAFGKFFENVRLNKVKFEAPVPLKINVVFLRHV